MVAPAGAGTSAPAGAVRALAADLPKIKVATSADIDTLNPFIAILASSTGILRFQYENLVASGTNNEIIPGLAEKWETSPDGKTWTFTMRPGLKWSDGQPLTAKDVAWTFNAVKTDKKLQQANGGLVENVAGVTATDDSTVSITLTAAQASNPGAELPIVPQHVWEKIKNPADYKNDKDAVGSGPYLITSWTESQSVELAPNPNFWRGAPQNGGITYIYYKNLDAQVQALKTGEVDVVNGLTPAQFDSLKGQQGVTTLEGDGRRYTALAVNPGSKSIKGEAMGDGNPALQDIEVRKAIMTAIDTQSLVDRVLQGKGKVGVTEVPTVYTDYFGLAAGTEPWGFDLAKANSMLDAAGYPKGADGIRTDKQGKPLNLRLMGRNNDPTHAQMAQFVQGWLKEIGIGLTTTMVSSNQVNKDSTLGKFDLYFTGWGIGPDPDFQLSINRCDSLPNSDGTGATSENNWCDSTGEFDKLYAAQHTELDKAKRADLVKQAFSKIYAAAVSKVIWYVDSLEAYRSSAWTGFTQQPVGSGSITAQNGYWGLYTAVPVGAATLVINAQGMAVPGSAAAATGTGPSNAAAPATAAGDTGSGFPVWVIIVIVVVIVAGAVLVFTRRRGTASDDKE